MELTLENISEQDTARIGKSMAPLLFPGAFIALFGDLGSGKTTFTKAVAEGLGIDNIQSPTFTIVREHGGRLSLLHFDAYRLSSEDELYAIGFDDYLSRPAVIIMEWCENVRGWSCTSQVQAPKRGRSHSYPTAKNIKIFWRI